MEKELERIHNFLTKLGWVLSEVDDGCDSYFKDGCIQVDICTESDGFSNEIVFFDDSGDFLHVSLDYYALIGALVSFRQIPFNF